MDKVSICGNQFRVDFLNEIWPIEISVVSLACLLKGNTVMCRDRIFPRMMEAKQRVYEILRIVHLITLDIPLQVRYPQG